MTNKELDIRLSKDEEKTKINILMGKDFDSFKYSNYSRMSLAKHNVSIKEVRKTYYQFDRIIAVTKRKGNRSDLYCFIYDLGRTLSMYIIFILDEKPQKLFSAYYNRTSQHKKIKNRIRKWIKKEISSNKSL